MSTQPFPTHTQTTPPSSTPPQTTAVELFNGASWTDATAMNTARGGLGGSGSSTLAVVFGGGNPTAVTNTESWDGTSLDRRK